MTAVDFSLSAHLAAFRLPAKYRLQGNKCRAFYFMSTEDQKDDLALEAMREFGYSDVDWEDRGAHRTIFDHFDTPEHFAQVECFRRAITPFMACGEDDAYELVMVLEDLNPRLFDALGASVLALTNATHTEHIAQACLSGRRYLESLADALFPASEARSERKLTQHQYRNRLWAYVQDNVPNGDARLAALGNETDRLVAVFNKGLHGTVSKAHTLESLAAVGVLTAKLLALNPDASRNPYLAFRGELTSYHSEILRRGLYPSVST